MADYQHIHHPDAWVGKGGAYGACFHKALSRWALKREEGETGWKVAVGIVNTEAGRHIHAWLEQGEACLMAIDGAAVPRATYYHWMGVERSTVRLVNPRPILRGLRRPIDREVVHQLLQLWGLPWKQIDGGVIPA